MNTYTSTRYENISNNLNDIVDVLVGNDELLMWTINLVDDPLSDKNPPIKKRDVLGNAIVLTRVNETILNKTMGKIFIVPRGGSEPKGRQGILADTVFEVNIALPNHLSYNYARRTDRFSEIASQIAKSLDGKKITGIGDVKVSTSFNTYKVNETYNAMMLYITTTNSIMGKLDIDYGR